MATKKKMTKAKTKTEVMHESAKAHRLPVETIVLIDSATPENQQHGILGMMQLGVSSDRAELVRHAARSASTLGHDFRFTLGSKDMGSIIETIANQMERAEQVTAQLRQLQGLVNRVIRADEREDSPLPEDVTQTDPLKRLVELTEQLYALRKIVPADVWPED